MKNLSTLLCLLSILAGVSFGCKKDSDEKEGNGDNHYRYQEKTLSIENASFTNAVYFNNNIMSIVLKATEVSNEIQLLFYKGPVAIQQGTFTYMDNAAAGYDPQKHFSGGYVKTDISKSDEIRSGTVVITKTGDNYNLKINAVTSKGPVEGSYTGKINER